MSPRGQSHQKYFAEPRTIRFIFETRDRTYEVPRFQRDFAWDDEKIEQLWNDMYEIWVQTKSATRSYDKQYLLGPVVFVTLRESTEITGNTPPWTVIDGQQRMASLTILLCVIRDVIRYKITDNQTNSTPPGYELLQELIEILDNNGGHVDWKLTLNSSDFELFRERIQSVGDPTTKLENWKNDTGRGSTKTFTDSQKKLMNAYKNFYEKITRVLATNFVDVDEEKSILENWENEITTTVENEIKTNPSNYSLEANFNFEEFYTIPDSEIDTEKEKNKADGRNLSVEEYRNYKVRKNRAKFKKKVREQTELKTDIKKWDESKNHLGELNRFWKDIMENNYVLEVIVDAEEDAFQIFETLNARGQTLTKSDLVKNMCLRQFRDNDREGKELDDKWKKIFNDNVGSAQRDDDFIRESLRSRQFDRHTIPGVSGSVKASNNNLFKILKEQIRNAPDKKEFVRKYLKELEADSEFVKILNDPHGHHDRELKKDLLAMKNLNAKHIRVPIITAYRKWGLTDDFRQLTNYLVKFFFRYRTVCNGHPSTLDDYAVKTAENISQGTTVNDIFDGLTVKIDENPDTTLEIFHNKFEDFATKIDTVARYVIEQLDSKAYGGDESDTQPSDDVTLEHILPKKTKKWKPEDFFKDYTGRLPSRSQKDMDAFIHKIGNLTLLKGIDNSSISNEIFSTKKNNQEHGYHRSEIKINRETLLNYDEWTAQIIEERQKEFAEKAEQVWDLTNNN